MLQHGKHSKLTTDPQRPLNEQDDDDEKNHNVAVLVCENSPSLADQVITLKTENERLTRQLAESKQHIHELHTLDHEYDAVITDLERQLLTVNDELKDKDLMIQTLTECYSDDGAHGQSKNVTSSKQLQSELNGYYKKEKKWKTEREQLETEIFALHQKLNVKGTKTVQLTSSTELLVDDNSMRSNFSVNLSDEFTEEKWQTSHSQSQHQKKAKKEEEKKKKFSLFGWSMC